MSHFMRCLSVLLLSVLLVSCGDTNPKSGSQTTGQTLSDIQEVWSQKISQQQESILQDSLTQEQKIAHEVSKVFFQQAQEYETQILDIFQKYTSEFSREEYELFRELLISQTSSSEIHSRLLEELGINISPNDLNLLIQESSHYINEENLHKSRLTSISEQSSEQSFAYKTYTIESIIEQGIESRDNWTQEDKEHFISDTIRYFIKDMTQNEIEYFQDTLTTINSNFQTDIRLETLTESSLDFDQESFLAYLESLTQEYEVRLNYKESIKQYQSVLEHEYISYTTQQEIEQVSETSQQTLTTYEELIHAVTQAQDDITQSYEVFETLSQTEMESYFSGEMNYDDLIVLSQEREVQTDVTPLFAEALKQSEFIDDSNLIQDLEPNAYIESLEGNALITNLAGGIVQAESDMILYPGYSIETFEASQVSIVFSDESILRLDQLSRVTIQGGEDTNAGASVEFGTIWARVIKPLFSSDSFRIEDESISLAVRGTSVYFHSSEDDRTEVKVVDSYTQEGTSSVTLQDKESRQSENLHEGDSYSKDAESVSKTSFERQDFLTENPKIGSYIKEDLSYMALLISDRARGFYNNPLSEKNDSLNLQKKLAGELETSIPQEEEVTLIFENSELSGQSMEPDTIYTRIVQDELISVAKENFMNPNLTSNIAAILSLEINQDNLRIIENHKNTLKNELRNLDSFTTQDINNLIENLSLDELEIINKRLISAKKYLQDNLNSGSPFIKDNISLPHTYKGVSIHWSSNNQQLINNNGIIQKNIIPEDEIVSFEVTLRLQETEKVYTHNMILAQRELSDVEKLAQAKAFFGDYIASINEFSDNIPLPDFNAFGFITPSISFSTDSSDFAISPQGDITQPFDTPLLNQSVLAYLKYQEAEMPLDINLGKIIAIPSPLPDPVDAGVSIIAEDMSASTPYASIDEMLTEVTVSTDSEPSPEASTILPTEVEPTDETIVVEEVEEVVEEEVEEVEEVASPQEILNDAVNSYMTQLVESNTTNNKISHIDGNKYALKYNNQGNLVNIRMPSSASDEIEVSHSIQQGANFAELTNLANAARMSITQQHCEDSKTVKIAFAFTYNGLSASKNLRFIIPALSSSDQAYAEQCITITPQEIYDAAVQSYLDTLIADNIESGKISPEEDSRHTLLAKDDGSLPNIRIPKYLDEGIQLNASLIIGGNLAEIRNQSLAYVLSVTQQHCRYDKNLSIKLSFVPEDSGIIQKESRIKLIVPAKGSPDSTSFAGECYKPLATAEYDSVLVAGKGPNRWGAKNYALTRTSDNSSLRPTSGNIFNYADISDGTNPACPKDSGESYADDGLFEDRDGYGNFSKLTKDGSSCGHSLYNLDGQSGLVMVRKDKHYLSYDISSLDLGEDDWMIEIDILGEDLQRGGEDLQGEKEHLDKELVDMYGNNDLKYSLLHSPGKFIIYVDQNKLKIAYGDGEPPEFGLPGRQGIQTLQITPESIGYKGGESLQISQKLYLSENIYIGNSANSLQNPYLNTAWNGFLDNLRLSKVQ